MSDDLYEGDEFCAFCGQLLNDEWDCENPNCGEYVPDYSWIADGDDGLDDEGREVIEDDEYDDEDEDMAVWRSGEAEE